jgi:hypothetical protein
MVVRPPESNTLVIVQHEGAALPRHTVLISDISRLYVQPTVRAATDAEGKLDTQWLVRGRRYRIIVQGDGVPQGSDDGIFVWVGQSELDLNRLQKELE